MQIIEMQEINLQNSNINLKKHSKIYNIGSKRLA